MVNFLAHLILGYFEQSEDIEFAANLLSLISDYSIYVTAGSSLGLDHDALRSAVEASELSPTMQDKRGNVGVITFNPRHCCTDINKGTIQIQFRITASELSKDLGGVGDRMPKNSDQSNCPLGFSISQLE